MSNDPRKNPSPPRLRAMDLKAMAAAMQRAGQPHFRARQLFQWVYEKGARDFGEMTNLPKDLRAQLEEHFAFGGLHLEEVAGEPDKTQKLVFRTDDGEFVETVLMREENWEDEEDGVEEEEEGEKKGGGEGDGEGDGEGEGEGKNRLGDDALAPPYGSTPPQRKLSLCVSSQVGCPLDCQFCMTGFGGFRRNLRVDEILDQIIAARRSLGADERIANLVFMGMGEPLLNLGAVVPALRLLTSPQAFNYATRRVTVSTAGVIPGMEEFARAHTGANLAVSLNATTQAVRDRIMPGCRRWPIADLLEACRRFPLTKRRRITFEYVLLDGLNDTPADSRRLAQLLRGIRCKINLILYNPDPRLPVAPTPEPRAEAFRKALADAHYTASLRRSKGRRHGAACGQLSAHLRNQNSEKP